MELSDGVDPFLPVLPGYSSLLGTINLLGIDLDWDGYHQWAMMIPLRVLGRRNTWMI